MASATVGRQLAGPAAAARGHRPRQRGGCGGARRRDRNHRRGQRRCSDDGRRPLLHLAQVDRGWRAVCGGPDRRAGAGVHEADRPRRLAHVPGQLLRRRRVLHLWHHAPGPRRTGGAGRRGAGPLPAGRHAGRCLLPDHLLLAPHPGARTPADPPPALPQHRHHAGRPADHAQGRQGARRRLLQAVRRRVRVRGRRQGGCVRGGLPGRRLQVRPPRGPRPRGRGRQGERGDLRHHSHRADGGRCAHAEAVRGRAGAAAEAAHRCAGGGAGGPRPPAAGPAGAHRAGGPGHRAAAIVRRCGQRLRCDGVSPLGGVGCGRGGIRGSRQRHHGCGGVPAAVLSGPPGRHRHRRVGGQHQCLGRPRAVCTGGRSVHLCGLCGHRGRGVCQARQPRLCRHPAQGSTLLHVCRILLWLCGCGAAAAGAGMTWAVMR